MAFTMTHLSAPTGAEALFALKALIKLAGYTVPDSSDGTTYGSGSDVITTGASGAGGLGNANAWMVVKNPDGPSYCIQRGSDNAHWRIKYSPSAGFSGGSPSATQVPSASDEGTAMLGSGTDSSPGFAVLFQADGTYRYNCGVFSTSPRAFYGVAFQAGGGNPNHGMMLDALIAGEYDPGDTDPFIAYVDGATTAFTSDLYNSPARFRCTVLGVIRQALVINLVNSPLSGGLNPNAISGKDDLLPIVYQAYSLGLGAVYHQKGPSSLGFWETVGSGTAPRTTPFGLQKTTPLDQMLFGIMVLPWDGSAVVV